MGVKYAMSAFLQYIIHEPRFQVFPVTPFYLRALGRDTLKTGKAWDDTSREDRRKVTQRNIASTTNIKNMHTLASVRRSYRRVINARYSVVYSSAALLARGANLAMGRQSHGGARPLVPST